MAIIIPIWGPMRGSIGANVFTHNKGGDCVRLRTTPTNPNTSRQQVTRAILGTFATLWDTGLSQDQRDAWDVYASEHPIINSLGKEIYITGLAWFVKCNARLMDAGATTLGDPPVYGAPSALASMSVAVSAATTLDVTFAPVLGEQERIQAWASLPVSLGSTPNIRQCRLVGYSPAGQVSPWAATLPHSFQKGQRAVVYAARMSEEGLMSAYLQAMATASWVDGV